MANCIIFYYLTTFVSLYHLGRGILVTFFRYIKFVKVFFDHVSASTGFMINELISVDRHLVLDREVSG